MKDKKGKYKIKSGEQIRVCMTSDFFLEEADSWCEEVWNMIRIRKDVKFFILTKRAERIKDNLPSDWFDGYETGTNFIKDNKKYSINNKQVQSKQDFLSNSNIIGKSIEFKLYDEFGNKLDSKDLYKPHFKEKCLMCGSKQICNSCSNCGKC
ncbi:MAG: hypothetical protein GX758_01860 [Tenericutes bacterium]|nr:hypothetical protein [Mycoplasmatota bacterium]